MQNDVRAPRPTDLHSAFCILNSAFLHLLFRLTDVAPGLIRCLRPVFIRFAWLAAPSVRRATAANAARLNRNANPRQFGLAVLGHFYDFVPDVGRGSAAAAAPPADVAAYRATRAQQRGAVLVTAHMGSFEVGLAALAAEEPRVHVVFKRDAIPAFDRLRRRLRDRLGIVEAPIDDGSPGAWARLREALLRDEVVVLQGDRTLPGQKGLDVALLGGTLTLPTGPFRLALASGSPVVPLFSIRQPDGTIAIRICPAITVTDVDASIRQYGAELAIQLEAHPTQWLTLQPAFREDAAGKERMQNAE